MPFTLLLAVSSCVLVVQCISPDHQHRGHETLLAYHNEWAVKVAGSGEIAELVAQQAGLHNAGSVSPGVVLCDFMYRCLGWKR